MGRRRRKADELLQGVLLVDKPVDVTSHDVCQTVRWALRLGKVGHGGTLDPFATGLLPLMVNGATRLMPYMQTQDKRYDAVVRLGVRTDTLDPTGSVTERTDCAGVTDDAILAAAAGFVGEQTQTIPVYSAARVDGKRLYEYARAGEDVELPTKDIEVFSFEVHDIARPEGTAVVDVSISVHCSVGTYVRALADDLGSALGVGGHLLSLRRTAAGSLSLDRAIPLADIESQAQADKAEREAAAADGERIPFDPVANTRRWRPRLGDALLPVSEVVGGAPVLSIPGGLVERVRSGGPLRRGEFEALDGAKELSFGPGDRLVLQHPDGERAVALARARVARGALSRLDENAIVFEVERVLR